MLLALGVGVWVVAGVPRIAEVLQREANFRDLVWVFLYLGFLAAFLTSMRNRGVRARRFAVVQSACALGLLWAGMPHFEGALLAVVGAQALLVSPWPVALTWVTGQGILLLLTVLPSHEPLGAGKATMEYLAFSLFAMTAFALRERERSQRLALARMQAELLGTRALLKDTVTMAEQSRIRRELHDSLGHHLAVCTAQLDAALQNGVNDVRIARAREALESLTVETRQVIGGMAPRVDFHEALSKLQGSIPDLHLHLDVEAFNPTRPDVAWAAFRAVQEAITNAHRHGGAKRVRVDVRNEGDAVRLRVENDGRIPATVDEGVGLGSMRDRLASAQGTLHVVHGPPFALEIEFPSEEGQP